MNDRILELAEKAEIDCDTDGDIFGSTNGSLKRFARLIAAECVDVCKTIRYSGYCPSEDGAAASYYDNAAENCEAAIRERFGIEGE